MSTTRKGRRNELQARKAYEAAGYWVYSPENASYGDNDLWNLFDLACLDPWRNELVFVQVKSNTASGLRQWCNDTRPFDRLCGAQTHFVVKHDQEGWRVIEPDRHGSIAYETVYDERKDDRVGPHRDTPLNIGDGLREWLRDD